MKFINMSLAISVYLIISIHSIHGKSLANVDQLIKGGEPIDVSEGPYKVSLSYENSFICGGSVLNETFILTAAHCLVSSEATSISVRGGSSKNNLDGVSVQAESVFINTEYNDEEFQNDVGIIKLSEPLRGDNIKQVILPNEFFEAQIGDMAEVTRWGWMVSQC